jgi:hypothetical protein
MASSPKSVTTTTKTVNNRTGVTKSVSVVKSGGSTTTTRTTTIGTPKKTSSAKSTSTPAKAAGTVLAERWIAGPNDGGWTMCGAVAVANHLLAVTGIQASNAAVERLYRDAGGLGDSGAPMEFLFAAAASTGLQGCRLASWSPAITAPAAGIALMLLPGIPDAHAAAITPGGLAVMWGDEVPLASLDALVLDAWSLTWHGQETT